MLRQLTLFLITTICYSQQVDVTKVYPFSVVESPPIFDGCLNIVEKDKKKCFEQYVNFHIQENLTYPYDLFDSQTGGIVLVSFIIDRNGYVSEVNTIGPNESFENEVKRVINLLSESQPAKINGISVDMNYAVPVIKTQENDTKKDNLVITEEDLLLKEYDLDKLRLSSFVQKLEIQQETDRKIPGINKSDLYYGNALKELINILEKEIEIKYLILSNKNPSVFYNTDFDIRKRSNKNKAERLTNNIESIPYDFIRQKFYSFPSINDTKRFYELIQELDNLEYVEIEEPSSDYTLRSIKQVKLVENQVEQSKPNSSIDRKQNNAEIEYDSTNQSKLNDGNILNQNIDKTIKSSDIVPINISSNLTNKTLDVESAKKRLKDLFFLFNQDLISKEVYEEFAIELRQIIDSEDKKNAISTSNLKISPKEALERIRSLRSFLDQGLISKETYEDAIKVLKDIASNIDDI